MEITKKRHLLSVIQKFLITCVMLVVISPFYISIVYALKNKNDLAVNRLAWPAHPTLIWRITMVRSMDLQRKTLDG